MDCLICYKLVIEDGGNKEIFSNPRIFANTICKLLEIPKTNSNVGEDSVICETCLEKLDDFKELDEKIEEIRQEIREKLTQSKDISQTLQNVYGGPMSKSSQIRMKLFQAIPQYDNSPKDCIKVEESASMDLVLVDKAVDIIPNPTKTQEIIKDQRISPKDEDEMRNPLKYAYSKVSRARSKSWLSKHMGKNKMKKFQCKDCERPHTSSEELQAHLESALTSNEIHKCLLCLDEFWGSQCLGYHMTIYHNHKMDDKNAEQGQNKSNPNSKIWKCSFCNFQFKQESHLKRHELLHGPKKFTCPFEECGMEFHRQDTLQKHLKNLKPINCGICKESFKSNGCLNHHKSISHGINYIRRRRPNSTFNNRGSFHCMTCKKRFLSKNGLKIHQISHGPLKFKCPINGCIKLFKAQLYLKCHLSFFHEKRKDFKCRIPGCGRMLSSKINFVNHQLKYHEKND